MRIYTEVSLYCPDCSKRQLAVIFRIEKIFKAACQEHRLAWIICSELSRTVYIQMRPGPDLSD